MSESVNGWADLRRTDRHSNAIFLMEGTVIHLQFSAYESWDSLFSISMSPTANL